MFLSYLLCVVFGLLGVAWLTLLERRVLALCQLRVGAAKVRIAGLLQPLLDGVKLLVKQLVVLQAGRSFRTVFPPVLTFILSRILFLVVSLRSLSYSLYVLLV